MLRHMYVVWVWVKSVCFLALLEYLYVILLIFKTDSNIDFDRDLPFKKIVNLNK